VPVLPETHAAPIKSDRSAAPSDAVAVETSTLRTWSAHEGGVQCVKWAEDGLHVLSGGEDQRVRLWSFSQSEPTWSADHEDQVTSLSISHDGRFAAAGDKSGVIVLRDLADGRERRRLEGHTGWISSLAFTTSDEQLVSGSFDGTIRRWDVQSGNETGQFAGYATWVRGLALEPTRPQVLCAGNHGVVLRFGFDGKADQLFGEPGTGLALATLRIAPDQQRLAAAGWGQRIRIWDRGDGAEQASCDGHLAAITELDFTPDGRHLVSASYDQSVRLWEVARRDEVRRYLGHQGPVRCVAVSPNGDSIVSGSADGTLRVWRVAE
jgi:WD40 repeat protein